MTRAKFKCDFKKGEYVSLSPVYCDSEENKQFFKATPGGSIQLHVVNEQGMATFVEGAEYYVDFTKADK